MNLSRFFINRPIFAAVISITIVIAGLMAVRGLPVAQYPEIAPPTVIEDLLAQLDAGEHAKVVNGEAEREDA